jgi:site-specific recombinase XerD
MNINFTLIKSAEITDGIHKGKAPLRFSIYYNGHRFQMGAGERSLIKAWDPDKQSVSRKDPDGVEINKRLLKKQTLLIDTIKELEKKDIAITRESIKLLYQQKVDEVYKGLKPVEKVIKAIDKPNLPNTFWEVVEHYRSNSKNSKETIRKFKQIEGHLKEFKPDLCFKDFTESFYDDYFLGYLPDLGVSDNTTDKHISEIKKMCNYALKRFHHIVIPTDYLDYKRVYENPFRLSLTWEEVKLIEAYKAPNEELLLAQGLFLISCYTGLRWQNCSQITERNIVQTNGQYYFKGITFKNGKSLTLALADKVVEILKHYNYNIPKAYNYDVNKDIQTIARAVKLNDNVTFTKLIKGKPVETTVPKWKKTTMHVARHSFAIRFLEKNKDKGSMALQTLKEILGHSSTSITEIYLKMGDERKNAMILALD